MSAHEIKPKQLRALLLLLVLVPLIPPVLMVGFVLDALKSERAASFERNSGLLQETLLKAETSLGRHLANHFEPATPESVHAFYRKLFDAGVQVAVVEQNGGLLAGA